MVGCYNATLPNASTEKVWGALRDFHDLSWSKNVVGDVTPVGAIPGTEVGAKRILNNAFHETLRDMDEDSRSFRYSIDDGPGPVAKEAVVGYFG